MGSWHVVQMGWGRRRVGGILVLVLVSVGWRSLVVEGGWGAIIGLVVGTVIWFGGSGRCGDGSVINALA